jgi:hypothetical protein
MRIFVQDQVEDPCLLSEHAKKYPPDDRSCPRGRQGKYRDLSASGGLGKKTVYGWKDLITCYIFMSTIIYDHLLANIFFLHYIKQIIKSSDFSLFKLDYLLHRLSVKLCC